MAGLIMCLILMLAFYMDCDSKPFWIAFGITAFLYLAEKVLIFFAKRAGEEEEE